MAVAERLTNSELATMLRCTHEEFGHCYLQAQIGLPPEQRKPFPVVAAEDSAADPLVVGLAYAQRQGWQTELLYLLVTTQLADDSLWAYMADTENDIGFLQAMSNATRNFSQPDLNLRGLYNGIRWTGKVMIDGQPEGSGILIGHNLFLTAWHVLKPYFQKVNGKYQASANGWEHISLVFDDFNSFSTNGQRMRVPSPMPIALAHDWCVTFSPCEENEIIQVPDDLVQLENHWDFVIIRTAKAIGLERRYAKINPKAVVPPADDFVTILQYPKGVPLSNRQQYHYCCYRKPA